MAALPANVPLTTRILAQTGDGEPVELFTVETGLELVQAGRGAAEVSFDRRKWRRGMRKAFRAAARAIR